MRDYRYDHVHLRSPDPDATARGHARGISHPAPIGMGSGRWRRNSQIAITTTAGTDGLAKDYPVQSMDCDVDVRTAAGYGYPKIFQTALEMTQKCRRGGTR
jgi:hypothetical protein